MGFITAMTIFAVTSRLVSLAIAKPVPNFKAAGGITIPLTRHSSVLNSNASIDLDAITSHGISIREKILSGLDNYEMNTGTVHPFAVKRSESRFGKRGHKLPLTNHRNEVWMGQISIGTPPHILMVQIDTGAADMWVLGTGCAGIPADRTLWDPISSESIEYSGQSFELTYGDGTIVRGDLYKDNVTIAGFTADPQTFGVISSYTSVNKNEPPDGALGLAFPTLSKFGAESLFESLIAEGSLIDPTISLKLSSENAEMYVGGTNRMLYKGDIAYTPVTVAGLWQVSMDDIRFNGHEIFLHIPVILDTGANLIYGDWERVKALYKLFGGTLKHIGGFDYYHLPCHYFPILSLTFGGKTFPIPSEVLNIGQIAEGSIRCYGAIVGHHMPVGNLWTIGTPFLRGVYSVFDYENLQVGFAELELS